MREIIMQENNTTIIEECLDCVADSSSSLLDDIEVILIAVAALLGIAAWAYKKYQSLNADGNISLTEKEVSALIEYLLSLK